MVGALFASSCAPCLMGEGPQKLETRSPGTFTEISLECSADVLISPSTLEPMGTIRVKAKENIVGHIITKVSGDQLKVEMENGCYSETGPMEIQLGAGNYDGFYNEGSGNMKCSALLNGEKIKIVNSGSGDIQLMLVANEITIVNEGSGSIHLEGRTNALTITNKGSGDVDTYSMQAEEVEAKNQGSGSIQLVAGKKLDLKLNGSGNIRYGGNPELLTQVDEGSGNIEHIHD